jgi:LysM repeat protein
MLCIVLGGVGYGVYVALNHAPPPEPSPADSPWNKPADNGLGSMHQSEANSIVGAGSLPTAPTANAWQNQAPASGNGATAMQPIAGPPPGATTSASPLSPLATAPLLTVPAATTPPQSAVLAPIAGPPPGANGNSSPGAVPADQPPGMGSSISNASNPALSSAVNVSASDAANQTPGSNIPSLTAPSNDAQTHHDYDASKRTVLTYLNHGQLVDALRELSRWYDHPIVPPEDQPHVVELLSQLAGTVIYSRDAWLAPPYEVRAGDTLESIAQQYQVPWQLLAKINSLQDSSSVMPGQKLKVVRGPFQAQLNTQQGWLALFVDGLYAGRYRVEVSGPLTKPNGDYPVAKFAAGQLGASPSGAPFISLGGDLHLRVPEDALPPGVSAIRISRQDMNDVFDILSDRSQVTIRR